MDRLADLYQSVILEHYKNPRNVATLEHYTRHKRLDNPLCGDRVELFLQVDSETIAELSHKSRGCAICVASASMMTLCLRQMEVAAALTLCGQLQSAVEAPVDSPWPALPEDLGVFVQARAYPSRVQCVTLAWRAATEALQQE